MKYLLVTYLLYFVLIFTFVVNAQEQSQAGSECTDVLPNDAPFPCENYTQMDLCNVISEKFCQKSCGRCPEISPEPETETCPTLNGCQCKQTWQFMNNTYSGCAELENFCWVDASTCPDAIGSLVPLKQDEEIYGYIDTCNSTCEETTPQPQISVITPTPTAPPTPPTPPTPSSTSNPNPGSGTNNRGGVSLAPAPPAPFGQSSYGDLLSPPTPTTTTTPTRTPTTNPTPTLSGGGYTGGGYNPLSQSGGYAPYYGSYYGSYYGPYSSSVGNLYAPATNAIQNTYDLEQQMLALQFLRVNRTPLYCVC